MKYEEVKISDVDLSKLDGNENYFVINNNGARDYLRGNFIKQFLGKGNE